MSVSEIVYHRLHNQLIGRKKSELPEQVVAWFGAMQAQDYAGVKWAVGFRCNNATQATVEQAIAGKRIIRTWLMRGTLQLVAAAEVRWMLSLLAPRLIANSARRYRQLELDDSAFAHSFKSLTNTLQDGKPMTRAEIMLALEEAGVSVTGQRGYHILRRAGLEGLICFGPMQDKAETFVRLDEWAPRTKNMERDDALAELTVRYFSSHGPATLEDFVWWSGLKVADARTGLDLIKNRLHQETVEGQIYWFFQLESIPGHPSPTAYLLPGFDEYYVGYKSREAVLDSNYDKTAVSSSGVFRPMLVIDGQIVGIWKQTPKKDAVIITPRPFRVLTKAETQALHLATDQYGVFLNRSVVLA